MNPFTAILLTLAICAAIGGTEIVVTAALVVALINEILRAWASRPESPGEDYE